MSFSTQGSSYQGYSYYKLIFERRARENLRRTQLIHFLGSLYPKTGGLDPVVQAILKAVEATPTKHQVVIDVELLRLESLGVTELRRRLRVERPENTALSRVSKSDLSTQDFASTDARRSATLELLRRRLATVYAEDDIVLPPTPPTDCMNID